MLKNKKRDLIIVFIIFLFVMSASIISRNPSLDIDKVVYNLNNSVAFNADIKGVYYKVTLSDEFFKLLQKDLWKKTRKFSSKDPMITINYAERHNIYFYSDKEVVIYDGYAGFFQKSKAYYVVPSDIANKLTIYIIENGIVNPQGVKDATFL